MRPLLMLLIALSLPISAAAKIYKWVDESGITHFGSQPPTAEKETVKIRAPEASTSGGNTDSAIMRQARDLDRRKAERQVQRTRQDYSAAVSEAREDYKNRPDYICTGVKNRLESAKEDWDSQKTQGYSLSDKQYHGQRIKDLERHRDNICR